MKNQKTTVDCACSASEHAVRFVFFDTDIGECYMIHYLNAPTFWDRLKYALKYIFTNRVGMGTFEETVIEPVQAEQIRDLMQEFLAFRRSALGVDGVDIEAERRALLEEQDLRKKYDGNKEV